MLWKLLKGIIWAFRPHKHGYSIKGFWGQTKHFNKEGIQIGYTIRGFWGERKRYDMNHNLISVSWRNFWGGYNTYDANGNLITRSRRNFGGGFTTVDREGRGVMRTYEAMRDDFDRLDVDDCDIMVHVEPKEPKYARPKTDNRKISGSSSKYSGTDTQSNASKSSSKMVIVKAPSENKETEPVSRGNDVKRQYKESTNSKNTTFEPSKAMKNLEELHQQTIDKTVTYDYKKEYVDLQGEEYVRILAFSYGELKEFPAIVTEKGEKLIVAPVLKGASSFEFDKKEIQSAQKKVRKDLDMSVVDNEFVNLSASSIFAEFEELFPDYMFASDGMERVQYELKCGLIVTENSWIKLTEKFC